jgi:biopolymer transport protein ExbD
MTGLVLYEAKVALLLAVFYICYRVLLSRETLHRLNRVVLTGSVFLSFVLPFCVLTFHRVVEVPAGTTMPALPALPQAPAAVTDVQAAVVQGGVDWWPAALALVYCAGIIFCLARIVMELVQISRIIRSGERMPQEGGTTLVVVDRDLAPFSWMKWIVLSREDYESGNNHILKHERAHIRLGHARNLLVIDLLSAMQWFNPVMKMLKDDLRAIYEYEADDAVLREGADIKEYQYSLIRKAVSASGYSITNSFNHSILKNRITMMSKSKSPLLRGLRALYLIPLVTAALACNAKSTVDYKVSENSPETTVAEKGNVVRVELKKDDAGDMHYYVNGTETGFDGLGEAVKASWKGDGFDTVSLQADPEIPFGFIDDVKNVLRGVPALKVNYSSPGSAELARRLPPSKEVAEAAGMSLIEDPLATVSRDNICVVRINSADKILYSTLDGLVVARDGQPGLDKFTADAVETIKQLNPNGIFSFRCDRGTSYGIYLEYQSALVSAYNTVREEYSMETYNKPMDALSEEERAAVLKAVPLAIYEAELTKRPQGN